MGWLRWVLVSLGAYFSVIAPAATRAELRFWGEEREHEQAIRSVYTLLPRRGKEVDVAVSEVSPEEWARVIDPGEPDAVGLYDDETRQLFLRADAEELGFTFAHEFGHHVYFASFTPSERRSWRRFWKAHRSQMPEGDAREDADEGFAECYAGTFYRGPIPWHRRGQVQQQIRSYF